jgi:tetratricopeptide (TPR) repeat protein
MKTKWAVLIIAATTIIGIGCATTRSLSSGAIEQAKSPALSVKTAQKDMIISVSPVRQTAQLLGTTGLLLGAGIDAVVNQKYRAPIQKALEGYDAGHVFEQRLRERLAAAMPVKPADVPPLGSTAGFSGIQEAREARLKSIADKGHDLLMDLRITYGIFGYEGVLVAKIDGSIMRLPENKVAWKNSIVASTESVLASDKLSDPTKQLGPDFSSPRLSVDEQAVLRWTADNGKYLKEQYEKAVDLAISALLVDLGLRQDALGEYCLARNLMNRKKFAEADAHFQQAVALDPNFADAQNARSVNLARNKQLEDAMALANQITERFPEYAPAYYNLAWWYAMEEGNLATARQYYDKAISKGMAHDPKLEKKLG